MIYPLYHCPSEMVVVERERASNCYSLSAYYFAKMIAELPFNMLGPILFGSVVYFLVGLNPAPEVSVLPMFAIAMPQSSFQSKQSMGQCFGLSLTNSLTLTHPPIH